MMKINNTAKAIIENSLFVRAIIRLVNWIWFGPAAVLRNWYHYGAIAGFFRSMDRAYQHSKLRLSWIRFCQSPVCNENSVYLKLVTWFRKFLECAGDVTKQSILYRICSGACIKLSNLLEGGIIGRFVKNAYRFFGPRGLLLFALTMYLPLDCIIRAAFPEVVGSVWDECLMLAALMYIMWHAATRRAPLGSRATNLDGYLILFFGGGLMLMFMVSPSMSIAIAGYRAEVQYLFWFFLVTRLIEDDHDFKIFYGSFVALGVLLGLHGIYQFIVAAPIPEAWVSQTEQSVRTRVYSITGSPNIMGSLLVLIAPMVAGIAYYTKQQWVKILAILSTGVMCLACIFTFSKGAWGGLVVAVIIFAVFLDRRLIALMGAAATGALLLIPSVASRITYLFTSDYAAASRRAGRSVRWEIGLRLLHDSNSWIGFGLGRYGGAVAMQNQVLKSSNFTYFYMDNYYLKTMVEMGYIGIFLYLLLLLGLILWCLRSIGRTPLKTEKPMKVLTVAMFSGMMGVLAHCIFENIFEVPYMSAYFWSMGAAILYLGYFRKKNPQK